MDRGECTVLTPAGGGSDDASGPPGRPRAIIDASSAILLAKSGLIDACCGMLNLSMTRSVVGEVSVPARPCAAGISRLVDRPAGIALLDDPDGGLSDTVARDLDRLHRGERDTLHHVFNGTAQFVIIDDGKGVKTCRRHDIPHINALLCPRLLHFGGRLTARQARAHFSRIVALGRYSARVISWAERCRRQDLVFFLGTGE